jgi:hypothetical protein
MVKSTDTTITLFTDNALFMIMIMGFTSCTYICRQTNTRLSDLRNDVRVPRFPFDLIVIFKLCNPKKISRVSCFAARKLFCFVHGIMSPELYFFFVQNSVLLGNTIPEKAQLLRYERHQNAVQLFDSTSARQFDVNSHSSYVTLQDELIEQMLS